MAKEDVKDSKPVAPVKIDAVTRAKVEEVIKNRALLAGGMGLVPVPGFNFAAVTVIQISMVKSITRLYDIEVKKSWIKNIISSVIGGAVPAVGARYAAGWFLKAPLLGVSLAALTAPAMNGLVTYAVGYMFVRYFESENGLLKANAKALGAWFKEGFKEGREKLGGAIAGKGEAPAPAAAPAFGSSL